MGDANEALFGSSSGAPGFKFPTVGDTVSGYITHLDSRQARVYGTNDLEFWPSGDKKMIAIVTVQTDLRDPSMEDDDGQRAVWLDSRGKVEAVRIAVKDAGARRLEEGGRFFLRYTGLGKAEKGAQPPKLYEAGYRKPTPEGLAVYRAAEERTAAKTPVDTSDPWAALQPDPGFLPPTPAPAAAPAQTAQDPWGDLAQASAPASTPQAVQQPLAAGNGASDEWVELPGGQKVNLTTMTPEAAAVLRRMQAGASA